MIQSKFDPLRKYLEQSGQQSIRLSFLEIEDILTEKLCDTAYQNESYWKSTNRHYCAKVIEEAGYKVKKVDLKNKTILFFKKAD